MLHLRVRQDGVVAHGVRVVRLVVDRKEEQRARGAVELGDLAKSQLSAGVAGPPGKRDGHT